jgi:hypothetical protein
MVEHWSGRAPVEAVGPGLNMEDTMQPRRSVLDGELMSMAREAASGRRSVAPLPFEDLSRRFDMGGAAAVAPAASDAVTLKLVVEPGAAYQVAQWVRGHGGEIASHGERVLVAAVPVSQLENLDSVKGLRRAEASRLMHMRLEDARGPTTGLDAALQTHPLTGQGVVVGVVDSGVDYTHDDFRNADGTTRLAWFGHARRLPDSSQSLFDEFAEVAINATLQGTGNVPQAILTVTAPTAPRSRPAMAGHPPADSAAAHPRPRSWRRAATSSPTATSSGRSAGCSRPPATVLA